MVLNVNRTTKLQWKLDTIKNCTYLQCMGKTNTIVLGIYNFEFTATIVDHVMIFKEVFFSQVRKFTVQ